MLLATVAGHDPRRLGPQEQAAAALGLSPADAVALQRLAYEQVQAAPAAEPTPGGRQKPKHKVKRLKATADR